MAVRALQPGARLPKLVAGAAALFVQFSLIVGFAYASTPRVPHCWPLSVLVIDPVPSDQQGWVSANRPDCEALTSIRQNTVAPRPAVLRHHLDLPEDSTIMAFVVNWTRPVDIGPGICKWPTYPAAAKRAKIEGTVDLFLTVDQDGRVTNARINQSSGHPILDTAALSVVSKCRYAQLTTARAVVAGIWELRYEFRHSHSGLYEPPPYVTVFDHPS